MNVTDNLKSDVTLLKRGTVTIITVVSVTHLVVHSTNFIHHSQPSINDVFCAFFALTA